MSVDMMRAMPATGAGEKCCRTAATMHYGTPFCLVLIRFCVRQLHRTERTICDQILRQSFVFDPLPLEL